jgi:hypothetical protein
MYTDIEVINEELIAPCGMNCAICTCYLASEHDTTSKGIKMTYCQGCRARNKNCAFVKKGCALLSKKKVKYCYECSDFPCQRLRRLDDSYRMHHHMSMIENLEYIKRNGIDKFILKEQEKWKCPICGSDICCHNGLCYSCNLEGLRQRKPKNKYRWVEK